METQTHTHTHGQTRTHRRAEPKTFVGMCIWMSWWNSTRCGEMRNDKTKFVTSLEMERLTAAAQAANSPHMKMEPHCTAAPTVCLHSGVIRWILSPNVRALPWRWMSVSMFLSLLVSIVNPLCFKFSSNSLFKRYFNINKIHIQTTYRYRTYRTRPSPLNEVFSWSTHPDIQPDTRTHTIGWG